MGKGAYEEFRTLAQVFEESGPGLLVHPVWQTERAYFVSLQLTEAPLPDYVRYRFEFWSDGLSDARLTEVESKDGAAPAEPANRPAETYLVRKGDTLWGIARRFGVELTALIASNPQIKNPNLIYPGDRVRLP